MMETELDIRSHPGGYISELVRTRLSGIVGSRENRRKGIETAGEVLV